MSFTLYKTSKSPRETSKTVYQSDESTFSCISETLTDAIPKKQPKLLTPISKEEAHAIWNCQGGIEEKRQMILDLLNKPEYKVYASDDTLKNVIRYKKILDLDFLFTNILMYSEEKAKKHNEKEMIKCNPFTISEY